VPDEKVYVDPLVMTIATNIEAGRIIFNTMRAIRAEFPQAHISCGLSNVSFGLPVRALINRTFLVLALEAGMDTAIVDPNDRELQAAMIAADLLLGQDKHCLRYTRAFRALEQVASNEAKPVVLIYKRRSSIKNRQSKIRNR
jgi:5-methyltetrahydrofolate--homocysteine methyltransferase